MAGRRSYGSYNDGCASAHALDLIGERWALIVVRELFLGPKRFIDLQRDVPGIGPAVLTARLRELEAGGIVRQRRLPPPAATRIYELTDWGLGLETVNAALSAWAVQSPAMPFEADMSPDTLVLAMRAHARPVPGADSRVMLWLTDSRTPDRQPVSYLATVSESGTTVVRAADPGDADARVQATTAAWKACVIAGVGLDDSEVAVRGSRQAVQHLLDGTRLLPHSRSGG